MEAPFFISFLLFGFFNGTDRGEESSTVLLSSGSHRNHQVAITIFDFDGVAMLNGRPDVKQFKQSKECGIFKIFDECT